MAEEKVEKGDKVKVEYEGKLEDGTVFDSSEKSGKPLEFSVGSGQIIKGFDQATEGMQKEEEKDVQVKPEEAYGERNPQLVQKIPKDKFPQEVEPKEGMMFEATLPNGEKVPVKVVKIEEDGISVDFNHPLAGKTLDFKIKVKEIEKGAGESQEGQQSEQSSEGAESSGS